MDDYYVVTNNGALVAVFLDNVYNYELPKDCTIHKFQGVKPDLNRFEWDSQSDTFKLSSNQRTKLQFLSAFTNEERMAIFGSTDPMTMDIVRMFNIAEYINVQDPMTIQSVQYFAHKQFITPERISEILA